MRHIWRWRRTKGVCSLQDADFLRLHAASVTHSGIAYAHQQARIGDIVRGLMLIYQVLEPEDMQDHVEFL